MSENQPSDKIINTYSIIVWIIGIFLLLLGIAQLAAGHLGGVWFLIATIIVLPPTSKALEEKSKTKLSKGVKIFFVIIFVIIGSAFSASNQPTTAPISNTQTETNSQPVQTQSSAVNTPDTRTAEQKAEDDLKSQIKNSLTWNNTLSYMDMGVEKSDTDRPAGSKMLTIKVKVNDYWSKDSLLRQTGDLSANIYKIVFASKVPAYDVFVWYYGDTTDRYGNKTEDVILTYFMSKAVFIKINWTNFDSTKLCSFLQEESSLTKSFDASCNTLVNIQ